MTYTANKFVTVYAEWSNIGQRVGYISIDNKKTIQFTCLLSKDVQPYDGKSAMQDGDILALEVYNSHNDKIKDSVNAPEELKYLIINDQMVIDNP